MNRRLSVLFLTGILILVPGSVFASPEAGGSSSNGADRTTGPDFHDPDRDGPIFMATDPDGLLWAVWAYHDGTNVDVAVSRWLGNNWSNPELVGEGNNIRDLDPKLLFMPDGTAALVWWQEYDDGTPSRVFVSYNEANKWCTAEAVSPEGQISRSPMVFDTEGDDPLVGYVVDDPASQTSNVFLTPLRRDVDPDPNGGANGPDPIPTVYTWEHNGYWWEKGENEGSGGY